MSEEKEEEVALVRELHFTVDPKQEPMRIDKFLLDRLTKVSRNRIQNAIKAGSVQVNGKDIKSNFKVKPGHKIDCVLPTRHSTEDTVMPEEMELDIVYEDADLLVVNKPSGLVVHPGVGNWTGTLVNGLRFHLQNQEMPVMDGNKSDRPGLVHRIDKDTSGLLVVAKSDFAMTHLAKQFFDHTVDREYYALVWSEFDEDEGSIEAYVGRHRNNRILMTVFEDEDEGKYALTHWKVLERLYYVSLLSCRLETGRTHQIRVHMKHAKHPLFNDAKYGGDKILKGTVYSKYKQFVHNCFKLMPRQALHAKTLAFTHPTTGERMSFDCPLPEDFAAVMDKWRNYLNNRKN